jgi:ubiquinone/menaquinone biosynthesis C-methylase UbiE
MDHEDHVKLLRPANLPQGGTWADFGAGSGAFTLALSELVGLKAEIYAIDKDRAGFTDLEQSHRARFGTSQNIHPVRADFTGVLHLPPLDGIVMANSLHFFKQKEKVLRHVRSFLKFTGMLLLVEYNVDSGNLWVPYPLSFETYRGLAPRAGFSEPRLLGNAPSRFLREFYSAVAYRVDLQVPEA